MLGAPDLNVVRGIGSVQGYSSLVDGSYASATGSHQATGLGQDVLAPRAIGDGTLDQLDTTILVAPRQYFLVTAEPDAPTSDPEAGERELAPGGHVMWYLGEDLAVTSIVIPDANASGDVGSGLRFGMVSATEATLWAPAATLDGPRSLRVVLDRPVAAVALVAEAGRTRTGLGSPSLTSEDGTNYVADGQLEAAVAPPRWVYRAQDGSFAVFADRFARPALTLHGSSGAFVHATAGPTFAPSAAAVSSPHGVEIIRSEAMIPGWSARWHPDTGPAVTLPIRRVGLVQAVEVPAGHGVLTWAYDPPGLTAGLVLSASAFGALLLVLAWVQLSSRRTVGRGR